MIVLFCYDGPMLIDKNGDYYGSHLTDEVYRRYYTISDELHVAMALKNISSEKEIKKYSKITITPFKFIEIPSLSNLKGFIFERKRIYNILSKAIMETDYVIVRLPSLIGYMSIEIAIKLGKPYIVEVVGCAWESLWNHSLKGKLLAPYSFVSMRRKVLKASYTVYVTSCFLQKRYPTKGESIYCSDVVLPNINNSVLSERLEKIKTIEPKKLIKLATIASVQVKYKGQKYVIKAMGMLKKQGFEQFEYYLVGPGSKKYLSSIAEKYNVSDKVFFLGPMPHDKLIEWLDGIDVYIQPSLTEGLPRTLIEAMSRGVTAFGRNVGGIPELLDGKNIFSKSKYSIHDICEKLKNVSEKQLLDEAIINFNEAKKYNHQLITDRRNKFFLKFKNESF